MANPMNPDEGTTGFTIFTLTEIYKTAEGAPKHMEMAQNFKQIEYMVSTLQYAKSFSFNANVVASYN